MSDSSDRVSQVPKFIFQPEKKDERLGEAAGVPEFDRVFDRLLELVNCSLNEGRESWEHPWDYRPGWDDLDISRLNEKQRYFYALLHWFIAGQRKVGVSEEDWRRWREREASPARFKVSLQPDPDGTAALVYLGCENGDMISADDAKDLAHELRVAAAKIDAGERC